jgi:predicted PurR-regulated permease PerM
MPFSFTAEQRQTAVWLLLGLSLVGLMILLGPVLTPFVAAAVLAYALNPGVDWLVSRRIGRLRLPRVLAVIVLKHLQMNYLKSSFYSRI